MTSEPDDRPGTILAIDDEPANLRLVERLLQRDGHDVVSTHDPRTAEDLVAEHEPDVILLDLHMPHLDGVDVLDRLGARQATRADRPPVIVLTADVTTEAKHRALGAGATDLLTKPLDELDLRLRVRNQLRTRRLHQRVQDQNRLLEERVRERTGELWRTVARLERTEIQLRTAWEQTAHRLGAAAEFRDEETGAHIQRMSHYAALLGQRAGLAADDQESLLLASKLHDVGKIGVPDHVLLKPGALTDEEFARIRTHSRIGHALLAGTGSELLDLAADIAWTHHERWDGSGYPRGLAGTDIRLEGRIAAVADVFDALTSDRVYRPAFPLERAVETMREGRGSHFDPELLDLFLDDLGPVLAIGRRFVEDPTNPAPAGRR